LIKLKARALIPARVKKRNTKGTQATKLCVTLLLITQVVNQLLNRDWFRVARCISLCEEPRSIDQKIRVGIYTGNGDSDVVIQFAHLLRSRARLQKLAKRFENR